MLAAAVAGPAAVLVVLAAALRPAALQTPAPGHPPMPLRGEAVVAVLG